mmetsp:Transcript_166/g.331  ORF Transcript_166/g.331 Transcript_166/m.331 type:complete len:168 (-) Transcript_166:201-704(-)
MARSNNVSLNALSVPDMGLQAHTLIPGIPRCTLHGTEEFARAVKELAQYLQVWETEWHGCFFCSPHSHLLLKIPEALYSLQTLLGSLSKTFGRDFDSSSPFGRKLGSWLAEAFPSLTSLLDPFQVEARNSFGVTPFKGEERAEDGDDDGDWVWFSILQMMSTFALAM